MRWAVIIAGGSGTRFWPLSTPAKPKQLLPLAGPSSTAESTVERLDGLVDPDRILLVTGRHLAGPLRERLGLPESNVLIEPFAKSTGPALVWATHESSRRDSDAIVLSQHADWHVPDAADFRRVASRAYEVAAEERLIVTVGVVPTRVETGYGYIVPGSDLRSGASRVDRFVEKPNAELAARLIDRGALWNSGLFCWPASTLLDEISRLTPEIGPFVDRLDRRDVNGFFESVADLSIDVGVLERSAAVAVVRGDFSWDDIGTWDALARVRDGDPNGNVAVGEVSVVGSSNCIAWSEKIPIVLSGVSNLVVIEANGRILVMAREQAPHLKKTLEALSPDVREI